MMNFVFLALIHLTTGESFIVNPAHVESMVPFGEGLEITMASGEKHYCRETIGMINDYIKKANRFVEENGYAV